MELDLGFENKINETKILEEETHILVCSVSLFPSLSLSPSSVYIVIWQQETSWLVKIML